MKSREVSVVLYCLIETAPPLFGFRQARSGVILIELSQNSEKLNSLELLNIFCEIFQQKDYNVKYLRILGNPATDLSQWTEVACMHNIYFQFSVSEIINLFVAGRFHDFNLKPVQGNVKLARFDSCFIKIQFSGIEFYFLSPTKQLDQGDIFLVNHWLFNMDVNPFMYCNRTAMENKFKSRNQMRRLNLDIIMHRHRKKDKKECPSCLQNSFLKLTAVLPKQFNFNNCLASLTVHNAGSRIFICVELGQIGNEFGCLLKVDKMLNIKCIQV